MIMKKKRLACLLVLFVNLKVISAVFDPEVRVRSCDKGQLKVTVFNATDGGIIYVQGSKAACVHVASDKPMDYTFDIMKCKLDWNGQFKLVIQKRALYQTSGDRVITVRCIVETDDIVVNGEVTIRDELDESTESVAKPMASMRLFHDREDVTGTDVTLDDMLNLQIELDDDYKGVVDILAKECHAASIPLIKSSCPVDSALFPNFAHAVRGELSASFAAFRPTILTGGSFTLVLSCTLAVCRGICNSNACREEDHRVKRAVIQNNDTQTIKIATVVKIVADDSLLNLDPGVCMNPYVLYSCVAVSSAVLLLISAMFVRYLRQYLLNRRLQLFLRRRESVKTSVTVKRVISETDNSERHPQKKPAAKQVSWDDTHRELEKTDSRSALYSKKAKSPAAKGIDSHINKGKPGRRMGSIVSMIVDKNVATAMEILRQHKSDS